MKQPRVPSPNPRGERPPPQARAAGAENRECATGIAMVARSFSHSINNSLAVAQGNLALLREDRGARPALAVDAMEDIGRALEKAVRLSRHLSALACWHDFTPEAVDLQAFFRIREPHFAELTGPGRRLCLSVDADLRTIHIDADFLELAINALIQHAADSPDPDIRVTCRRDTAAPARLAICVRDAGAPLGRVAAARLRRAPFSTRVGGNLGLGLWLASQVARAGGGSLIVRSLGKRGNLVGLSLPCRP